MLASIVGPLFAQDYRQNHRIFDVPVEIVAV